MNFINSFLFITFLLLGLGCTPKSGEQMLKKEGLPVIKKVEDCPYKLYFCQGEISRKGTVFFRGNEINEVKLITETSIYKNNPLKVDETHLTNKINRIYPDKNEKGICALDWEGKALEILEKSDSDSPEFNKMLNEFIKALKIAKRLRPNIKWGYYGIPIQNYWHRNDNWRNRSRELLPLFKESDIIFPSVYDFYEDSVRSRAQDAEYVNDNIVLGLEIGARVNKPVMPFVWHRYHNSNKKKGFSLIPADEFKDHVDAALKANFQNKRINTIIWWGADRWFHNSGNKVLKTEAAKYNGFDNYQSEVLVDYTQLIHELFEENCK